MHKYVLQTNLFTKCMSRKRLFALFSRCKKSEKFSLFFILYRKDCKDPIDADRITDKIHETKRSSETLFLQTTERFARLLYRIYTGILFGVSYSFFLLADGIAMSVISGRHCKVPEHQNLYLRKYGTFISIT